jgi:glycine cleavage system H lipoate-binding protein
MKILAHIATARQAEYIIALLGLFGFIVFWRILNGPGSRVEAVRDMVRTLVERFAGFLAPTDVLFHPGHTWARVDGVNTVTVGMDDFAAKLLGSADSISLPKLGSQVRQGTPAWEFRTDSRVIPMLSPVEGEVVAVNETVSRSPGEAFEDPYGRGWLFQVKSDNMISNSKNMIPSGMVGQWLETVRQTLACRGSDPALAPLFADGGEPVRGLARVLDPEGWDDLAREFFLTK